MYSLRRKFVEEATTNSQEKGTKKFWNNTLASEA